MANNRRTDLILLWQIYSGWGGEVRISSGKKRIPSRNELNDDGHTRGFISFYVIPFPDYSGKDRTFPGPLSLFSTGEVTAHHRSVPLVRNTLGSKISRSYFILKWNTFKYTFGMSSSSQEITGEERENICSLGWSSDRAGRAEPPNPSMALGTPSVTCLQPGMGHRTFPHGSQTLGLFMEQVVSLPEQQLHPRTFQWGWVQGQGYGGEREGWEVLSTPCSSWEFEIKDIDRPNCTTAQEQWEDINPICFY